MREIDGDLSRSWVRAGYWTDDTLGQLLQRSMTTHLADPFTVRSALQPYRGTLGEVLTDAGRLAAGLRGTYDIGPGSVVAFQLTNSAQAAHVFYAAALLGATVVPIVHFYGPSEVGYILGRTPPDVYVTFDAFGPLSGTRNLHDSTAHLDAPVLVADRVDGGVGDGAVPLSGIYASEPLAVALSTDPSLPALVGYTSGTTTAPKGVIHSHRTIGFESRQLTGMQAPQARPGITGAPVGHAIGMLGALLIPVLQGRPIHLIDVWDPGTVLGHMAAEGLTSGSGSTYFLTSLLDHPDFDPMVHAPLMSHIGLGGSAVPVAVGERAAALGISTVRMYGSTEHPSITGSYHDDPFDKRIRTDGRLLEGCELRVADDGELFSRGPDCFVGYTDPALTAEVFDSEGWYRTEDVGVMDADGFLTITDRKKDIIIRGGENVSAAEIEEVIAAMPGVLEVAVVAAPDVRLGEHACALVRGTVPSLEAVRDAMRDRGLAKQKWPEEVRGVEDFPRTATGKIQKFVLRQRLRDEAG